MGMFTDLFELVADVPPMLATAWAVWLGTGALIVMWFRRVDYEVEYSAPAPRTVSKPKPASRPSSIPDMHAGEHGNDTAAERKPPAVVGDPFGDLATLLDQPVAAAAPAEPAPAPPRAPADSPILSSSGSPIRPQISHRLNTDQK
jgi:hypothetical protein